MIHLSQPLAALLQLRQDDCMPLLAVTLVASFAELGHSQLVARCAAKPNDQALWREFMRRFQQYILFCVIRSLRVYRQKFIGHYAEIAEDIAQEVHFRLLQKDCRALKAFEGETDESFYSYLSVISERVTLNWLRRGEAKKRPQLVVALVAGSENGVSHLPSHESSQPTETTDDEVRMSELYEQIDYYLDLVLHGKHRHRDKVFFQLHYYYGLEPEEIAKLEGINMSPHAVEVAISRARQRLLKYARNFRS